MFENYIWLLNISIKHMNVPISNLGIINYIIPILFCIVGFIGTFVYTFKHPELDDGFLLTFLFAIVLGLAGCLCGLIILAIWSIILFLILPIIILSYLIYKYNDIKNWFIKKFKSNKTKQAKNIIKDITTELKAEELAKQAWETLKNDFPDIRYEKVLESIKKKI
jgi:hypothetical protein